MSENYADESVALLLQALRLQNPDAASELWGRYFEQLRKVARRRLGPENAAPFDSEDVAISAFHRFCQAIRQGRFRNLRIAMNCGDCWFRSHGERPGTICRPRQLKNAASLAMSFHWNLCPTTARRQISMR